MRPIAAARVRRANALVKTAALAPLLVNDQIIDVFAIEEARHHPTQPATARLMQKQ
jgi:hypothetical protein